jgi:hypothetical protein
MTKPFEVDVWLRGTNHATTVALPRVAALADAWTDEDVRALLTEMLLAIEQQRNPGGEPPPVALRGFNWIVSSHGGGALVHLELQTGTASAGPFPIDERRLADMIARVMTRPAGDEPGVVH